MLLAYNHCVMIYHYRQYIGYSSNRRCVCHNNLQKKIDNNYEYCQPCQSMINSNVLPWVTNWQNHLFQALHCRLNCIGILCYTEVSFCLIMMFQWLFCSSCVVCNTWPWHGTWWRCIWQRTWILPTMPRINSKVLYFVTQTNWQNHLLQVLLED